MSDALLMQLVAGVFPVPPDVGQKWAYSNVDAGVLGMALGARVKTTYEALLQARVTGPLKMGSTAVAVPDRMRPRLAVGYDANRSVAPAWNVPALAGAGSLRRRATHRSPDHRGEVAKRRTVGQLLTQP